MSTDKSRSLDFYHYLCQKIGSAEDVRVRRLCWIVYDLAFGKRIQQITSGSKGEGLDIKGSDLDIMFIDSIFKVYESDRDVTVQTKVLPLVMDTENTHPCFTQLRLPLQILLKEIVEDHEDFKGLLCSYFLKTLIFWISEESDPSIWKPDNIIPCFMACLKRLIYCVEYSTLLHYFIPDSNLLYMRFTTDLKQKMTNTLKNLYQQGINCFVNSETLKDFTSLSCKIPVLLTQKPIKEHYPLCRKMTLKSLLYYTLHHCRTDLARRIFTFILSPEHDELELQDSKFQPRSNNKHQYNEYKRNLGKLSIVLSSKTIPGWLMLASFFYVHKQYNTSIIIINHALKKHQDEEFYQNNIAISLIQNKDSVRTLLQKEKIPTQLKELTLNYISLGRNWPFFPPEVKLKKQTNLIPTLPFAHFLHFLCYYHLHANTSCKQSLQKIYDIYHDIATKDIADKNSFLSVIHSTFYIGIGFQMIGDTITARKGFNVAAHYDITETTDAAERLSSLS